jgi:hypothetical protein
VRDELTLGHGVCVHLQPAPEGTSVIKIRTHPKVKPFFFMIRMMEQRGVEDPMEQAGCKMLMARLNPQVLRMVSAPVQQPGSSPCRSLG